MRTVTTIADIRAAVSEARAASARVGFVPTMGALHAGHLSLVERSSREADLTVMSIFVNPLQFGPSEDLARYPRPVDEDNALARGAGVDILFRPEVSEMYPAGRMVRVTAGAIASGWEGASRPGHFDGVLTVVAKLFNIVAPDIAVFGQKDLQQAALVKAMVRDLDMPVEVIVAPIVRDDDGLAMSSRNAYLSADDRVHALSLSRALREVIRLFARGERSPELLEEQGREVIDAEPGVTADYLGVVDPSTFTRPDTVRPGDAAIVAARVGNTRLIDNVILGDDRD
jgi:pantoate--beta-alanine ligase